MATTAEQLAEINAAITKILTGAQEYQMLNGIRVRRADLGQLMKERERLEKIVAGETYGDATVAYFDRR